MNEIFTVEQIIAVGAAIQEEMNCRLERLREQSELLPFSDGRRVVTVRTAQDIVSGDLIRDVQRRLQGVRDEGQED